MNVHYPKLYNMAHLFSFNVFTHYKGSINYILFPIQQKKSESQMQGCESHLCLYYQGDREKGGTRQRNANGFYKI